jgi:hypothetical protein
VRKKVTGLEKVKQKVIEKERSSHSVIGLEILTDLLKDSLKVK